MNAQMAYLIGMILGNGEIRPISGKTQVSIELPHKNLFDDNGLETSVYVRSSLNDITTNINPLINANIAVSSSKSVTTLSFELDNQNYIMREIMRYIGNGTHHSVMTMNQELFADTSFDEKTELLRGIADVTGYIRKSNIAFGQEGHHRVYLEIPHNWQLVIDIANMLKCLDIPVQTIDFGHPNFRDSYAKKYNLGYKNYWKKEHQIKIWACEFERVGFNIEHKKRALKSYVNEQLSHQNRSVTHKYYWQKPTRIKQKTAHPMESDSSLPISIRGKHFNSWTELAMLMGYHG